MYIFFKIYMGIVFVGDSCFCEVFCRGWWVYIVCWCFFYNLDYIYSYKVINYNFMNIENIKKNSNWLEGFLFLKNIL